MSQCLAYTGSNLLLFVVLSVALVGIGLLFVRSTKGRAALVILALVGGGLLISQATAKPASAACVATTTTAASPSTTTTTLAPTTTTVAPASLTVTFLGKSLNGAFVASNATTTIKVCETSNLSNCVNFAGSSAPGSTQSLLLGTSPGAVTVSAHLENCQIQLWNTAVTPATSNSDVGYVVESGGLPDSTPTSSSPTTYSNGGNVYVSDWSNC